MTSTKPQDPADTIVPAGPSPLSPAQDAPAEGDTDLRWIQIMATAASIIGLVGLFALLVQSAHAATPNKRTTRRAPATDPNAPGFTPGGRPFPSPFANSQAGGAGTAGGAGGPAAGKQNFFDEEEEDDFSANGGNRGSSGNGGSPTSTSPGGTTGASSANSGGVSMGGQPPNGVISHSNVASIPLDVETGEGGKELVTDFNFPDADIVDIARTLGKLTGKNFILDKDVKGRITLISNSPITVSDAWKAFLTALDVNGLALIPSGRYIRIAKQRDARDKQLKTYTGDYSPDTDALVTRVFPLKYIDADEVARTFRSFMPPMSRIIPYEQTNTVIVTDTGSNISKLSKMLEILDVEGYDVGIETIPVKYASAADLQKLIDQLIPGTGGGPAAGAPHFGGFNPGARGGFTARRTKEGGVINTIIADDRTNTLIVHANSKGAEQVRALVHKLDQKLPPMRGGGKVHVIYLQFADAEATATTLNNLSQGAATTAPHPAGGGTSTGVNPVAASLFEGAIKISPDKATNSLVVNAAPGDFEVIQRVVARLDIPRDEVFVECIIMEVQIGKQFTFSANIASPPSGIASLPNGQDLQNFIMNPLSANGAVLGFQGGHQYTFINPTNNMPISVSSLMGLVTAIQETTKSNVLATPQIIALDNSEATFEQEQDIPIPQNTVTATGLSQVSFGKQPVTISIKIKPSINKLSNFVKLDVTAKLGSIFTQGIPQAVQGQAVGTLTRTATATVVVGDSDTMVLGGLIRDEQTDDRRKIPLLGDIPILGWLFSSDQKSSTKSNLLIFMTPHIVRQYDKVRAILDRKLKERDDFLEKQAGGQDPFRDERDRMIRGLPDVKALMNDKPQTTVTIDPEDTANPTTNPFTSPEGSSSSGNSNGAAIPQMAPGTAGAGAPGTSSAPRR